MSIDVARHGRVVEINLNRPEAGNAFDRRHYRELAAALRAASTDPSAHAVLLTATGRIFSAGADLETLAQALDGESEGGQAAYDDALQALESLTKPLVAAVNGAAVGIGFTMLGHADVVLVGERARFCAPFASLGLVPEAGSTATLPTVIGPQWAAYLLLTGDWMSADEAVESGLALRKTSSENLRDEALAVAVNIARHALSSIVTTKALIAMARPEARAAARQREDAAFVEALTQAETRDLVRGTLSSVTGGTT